MDHPRVLARRFSYNLLKEITDDFSKERKLGSGGYGKVYKGVHKDGETIAVKLLYDMPGLDDDQFQIEFNNLMCLKHHNIVRLVGYCYDTQQECVQYKGRLVVADRIHRALCFEYAHNGSLNENLSDEYNGHDWSTRYQIIKGICTGLEYLHQKLKPPMLHLDLKPANILLDENMLPKIADFGLSRLFGQEKTKITKSSIGTRGYLPPEYVQKYLISSKFDIFSLGVIIIKVMAGPEGYSRCAEMSSQEFVKLVHENWRARFQAPPICEPELESYYEQIETCIEIALKCVETDRHKRPSIRDIVDKMDETESKIRLWSPLQVSSKVQSFASASTTAAPSTVPSIFSRKMEHASVPTRYFSYYLLKEITDGFSQERQLGSGGYGKVYKGVYKDGETIAVKLLYDMPGLDDEQFKMECNNLMCVQHHNIVRLVGYCHETWKECVEYNGRMVLAERIHRVLCFEYVHNGSLGHIISDESSGLDWSTRYNIIEGICYGLCHLHAEIDKPIIHLDLKPANILLDDGMVPKITDFGLSRWLDQQQTICTSSRDGTFGYMAPEFLHGGTITPKSDIFSLGVIIMEVVTGHRDYPDITRTSSDDFIKLALEKWRNVLQKSPGYGSLETDCEQVKRCIQVGIICVNPDRTKRPPITKVINMLQGSESIDYDISKGPV